VLRLNLDQIPFVFHIFGILGAFQTAYFFIDGIQILFFFPDKTWSYTVAMTVHHLFAACCSCSLYFMGPYLMYIYAINTLIEFSNIFLNIRYFGKTMQNETLYFIGGVGTLLFYPLFRISLTVYCAYVAYFGSIHLLLGPSVVFLILLTNTFFLLLSTYYSLYLFSKPKAVFLLQSKQKSM